MNPRNVNSMFAVNGRFMLRGSHLWRFCVSTKGRLGGGRNVHPKCESSMVVPGLEVSSEPGWPL